MYNLFDPILPRKTVSSFVALTVIWCVCCGNLLTAQQAKNTNRPGNEKGLKDYYKAYFPVGVAIGPRLLTGADSALIVDEFNSITAENAMKMGPIHPEENRYNWSGADAIVDFAQRNGLKVRGHNLLWNEQAPSWFFTDAAGKQVSKEVLFHRLKDHITTVVGRYKGKIYAWDVVNEAIDNNPKNFLRDTNFYRIGGQEIIAKAFEYAHAADPDALLFYNDFNEARPEKRERIYTLLKWLVDAKVPVHGVGMQAHWSIYEPAEKDLKDAIERYASLGLKVQITELDISPWEKDARKRSSSETYAMTPDLDQKQAEQYGKLFNIFREYKSVITGITFWNLTDKYSWMKNRPPGSDHHPLLFDENVKRKKAYWEVVLAQTDTLVSGVISWNKLSVNEKGKRELIKGNTRDLASLSIHSSTLAPGQTNHPLQAYADLEELVVVKEGVLTLTVGDTTRSLGPGGIALIVAGDQQSFKNTSGKPAVYYVLQLKSKNPVNIQRAKQAGGSFMRDWSEMVMRTTDKGESRPIVDRPSSMFGRFEMHATALNPGFASHDPHTHRSEEIILMIKGNVTMQIGQSQHPASAGDLVYLASGVLHNAKNAGSEQCGYFAIQWRN